MVKNRNISSDVMVVIADGSVKRIKVPSYHRATRYQFDIYVLSNTKEGDKVLIDGEVYEHKKEGLFPVFSSRRSFKNWRT